MVSNDPIKDYMRRHACSFPEALDALAAQLGPPTAHDIRRALQTLGRAGAPTRCSRRRDRPHRLGLTTGHRRPLVLRLVLQVVTPLAITDFSAGYPSFEKEGAILWAGFIRPALPEMNCDRDKSGPVARDRIKESRRAIRIGGVGVRERGTSAPGRWDPPPRPRGSGPLSLARKARGAEDRLWNSRDRDRFGRLLWSRCQCRR
jgi:hypothetical protein